MVRSLSLYDDVLEFSSWIIQVDTQRSFSQKVYPLFLLLNVFFSQQSQVTSIISFVLIRRELVLNN